MLSFVVQNFNNNSTLIRRTRRYKHLVLLWFSDVNYLILKSIVAIYRTKYYFHAESIPHINLYRKHFIHTYWPRLLTSVEVDKGPYTNNLILSTVYWVKYTLSSYLTHTTPLKRTPNLRLNYWSLLLTTPITYLLFALKNKPFRSLIIYFVTWLMYGYYPYRSTFTLPYGFILWPGNLSFFMLNSKDYLTVYYL